MCSCFSGTARATRGMRRAFNRKFRARWLGSSASGGAAEVHREQLSPDSAQFCSSRRRNSTLRHPELRKWQNPVVVHPELATMYVGFRTTAESGCTIDPGPSAFGATAGHLEVARCRALCEDGALPDAVDALDLLVQRSRHVPCSLFYRALKRCIQNKNLALGKCVHALTVRGGYEGDAFLATHFIVLYASHSRLEEAMRVFIKVPKPSTYNWATIISACARHGEAAEAIRLYRKMYESTTCNPDDRLYSAVLRACTVAKDLVAGKEVHSHILASSGKPQKLAQAGLINMYVKCGCLEDARRIFDRLTNRNVVTWTTMIAGYAQQGMGQEALRLYSSMRQEGVNPNAVTYLCLLQACAIVGVGALNDGKQLHAHIEELGLEENATLGSSLVNMYAKCGSFEDARRLFDKLSDRNRVAWTAVIAGYAQRGMGVEALTLYSSMQRDGLLPDNVTYVCLLQACAAIGVTALQVGKQLHAQIEEQGVEQNAVLCGSVVNMYVKCGSLEDARRVFDKLSVKSLVAWTAMISGYVQQGMGVEALRFYNRMEQHGLIPDTVTFKCLLQACATVGVGALRDGKQLHAQIQERCLDKDAVLGGSLVNMYVKCGSLEDARRVFDNLPDRNVVAWSTMIAGYAHQGLGQEALHLYSLMQQEGLAPNSVTFICLLQACASFAALPLAEQLHAEIVESGMQINVNLGAALINMYSKCGNICESQRVFDSLSEKSIEAWSALVDGYARQGDSQVVFDLLDRMLKEGVKPDQITFLSVLTVCSHVGLVSKGREYFNAMSTDYGISATMEHYVCMVDLLGRAGHLREALQMAKNMPFPANDVVWLTLLGACRKWRCVEIGQEAFKCAASIDEKNAAAYVLMSNIYSSSQMWEAAKEIQGMRIKLGACKEPGESWWTDMSGEVHTFLVGDKNCPESEGGNRPSPVPCTTVEGRQP